MAKDPAALFYIDTWLTATAEMKADCRGWYLNLILHQYDKRDLPNDVEELASLANVRISEFEQFKQVFEQVLKHKFKLNSRGRLENDYATEILRKREVFKDKRSMAGRISYFLKFAKRHFNADNQLLDFLKHNVNLDGVDLKNEQVLEQVFKQVSELYINGDGDINTISLVQLDTGIQNTEKVPVGKFNTKPLPEHFNGLPDMTVGQCIQYMAIVKGYKEINEEGIKILWELFKTKNLNGKKFYNDEHDVYSHFINSLTNQPFYNGAQTPQRSNANSFGKTQLRPGRDVPDVSNF